MTNFLDRYTIRRVWWAPWRFAAYGWVSDAPYGMCLGRISLTFSDTEAVKRWMQVNCSSYEVSSE